MTTSTWGPNPRPAYNISSVAPKFQPNMFYCWYLSRGLTKHIALPIGGQKPDHLGYHFQLPLESTAKGKQVRIRPIKLRSNLKKKKNQDLREPESEISPHVNTISRLNTWLFRCFSWCLIQNIVTSLSGLIQGAQEEMKSQTESKKLDQTREGWDQKSELKEYSSQRLKP